jgi:hypothetical protein
MRYSKARECLQANRKQLVIRGSLFLGFLFFGFDFDFDLDFVFVLVFDFDFRGRGWVGLGQRQMMSTLAWPGIAGQGWLKCSLGIWQYRFRCHGSPGRKRRHPFAGSQVKLDIARTTVTL